MSDCLHCAIVHLAEEALKTSLVNEVAFKEVEALAELLAAVGNPRARELMIRSCVQTLRRMVSEKRVERLREGLADFTQVRPS